MDLRSEVFSHHETLWVLCIGQEVSKKPLSPLLDMVDWYNNQLLTKGLQLGQISYELGSKTLLPTTGFLPLSRLLILGLGDEKNLSESSAKDFLTEIDNILEGLNEKSPWIILSPLTPSHFVTGLNKGKSKLERLTSATVSVN